MSKGLLNSEFVAWEGSIWRFVSGFGVTFLAFLVDRRTGLLKSTWWIQAFFSRKILGKVGLVGMAWAILEFRFIYIYSIAVPSCFSAVYEVVFSNQFGLEIEIQNISPIAFSHRSLSGDSGCALEYIQALRNISMPFRYRSTL